MGVSLEESAMPKDWAQVLVRAVEKLNTRKLHSGILDYTPEQVWNQQCTQKDRSEVNWEEVNKQRRICGCDL